MNQKANIIFHAHNKKKPVQKKEQITTQPITHPSHPCCGVSGSSRCRCFFRNWMRCLQTNPRFSATLFVCVCVSVQYPYPPCWAETSRYILFCFNPSFPSRTAHSPFQVLSHPIGPTAWLDSWEGFFVLSSYFFGVHFFESIPQRMHASPKSKISRISALTRVSLS